MIWKYCSLKSDSNIFMPGYCEENSLSNAWWMLYLVTVTHGTFTFYLSLTTFHLKCHPLPNPHFHPIRTQVNGESTPLRGAGMEVVVLHVEVPGADCLWSQSVEQRYLGAWGNTHCTKGWPNIQVLQGDQTYKYYKETKHTSITRMTKHTSITRMTKHTSIKKMTKHTSIKKMTKHTSIERMTKHTSIKKWPNIQVLQRWPNIQVLKGWPNIQVLKGWPNIQVSASGMLWRLYFTSMYENVTF